MLTNHQPARQALCVAAVFVTAAVLAATGLQAPASLAEGRQLFYNAQYREAAEMSLEFLPSSPDEELARDELRSSALLFQLRRLLEPANRQKGGTAMSFDRCVACADLVTAFMTSTAHGQQSRRCRRHGYP